MRVKMKGELTGTRNGEPWPRPGGEIDLPDDEAAALCANGMAVQVKVEAPKVEAPRVETAVVAEDSEQATGLTTKTGPVKRGPGRPRKNPE